MRKALAAVAIWGLAELLLLGISFGAAAIIGGGESPLTGFVIVNLAFAVVGGLNASVVGIIWTSDRLWRWAER